MIFDTGHFNDWHRNMEGFVINDIRESLANDRLETGLIILTLIATECVSGYYTGRMADKTTFVEFMNDFYPEIYRPYSTYIYESLRNGLLHDHTIVKPKKNWHRNEYPFELTRQAGLPHLESKTPGQEYPVLFNRSAFAIDFLAAWDHYLQNLLKYPSLQAKLVTRINQRPYLIVT